MYSVGGEVGEMVFRFEGYFEISMFKEFCNKFGLYSSPTSPPTEYITRIPPLTLQKSTKVVSTD